MYFFITSTISILIDIMFIWFLIIKVKGLQSKQILLYVSLLFSSLLASFICYFDYNYQMYFYLLFNIFSFLSLKILFRGQILLLDFLLIGYVGFLLTFVNFVVLLPYYLDLINYTVALIISRVLIILTIIIISRVHLKSYYIKLINLWDRKIGNKIRAITLRNGALIVMNIGLYITNILLYKFILRR